MTISLNQLLIHSRNTVQVCQRIHVLLASSTHRYTLCGKSVARAWSDPGPSLWTSSVMLTKCPPLTRTEELEPAFTRQNIAEWAINVLKYHLHANTGTTHSSRPGQRELLISRIHYSGYSALAAATSWKISDEEDKNISYKLYPGSRGAGRRELDCRVVLTSPRTASSTTAAADGKILRSRFGIN